ncbi:hypothetical protein B0H19DRAFT_1269150 [Mycena capillaripes]|nr:hypothetical protein B0H19DRAFT_1269150 [Mycena capillaripes]
MSARHSHNELDEPASLCVLGLLEVNFCLPIQEAHFYIGALEPIFEEEFVAMRSAFEGLGKISQSAQGNRFISHTVALFIHLSRNSCGLLNFAEMRKALVIFPEGAFNQGPLMQRPDLKPRMIVLDSVVIQRKRTFTFQIIGLDKILNTFVSQSIDIPGRHGTASYAFHANPHIGPL